MVGGMGGGGGGGHQHLLYTKCQGFAARMWTFPNDLFPYVQHLEQNYMGEFTVKFNILNYTC